MTAFEEFGVIPELAKAVDEMEWLLPTDVQAEAIPLILGGGDVLMAAEVNNSCSYAFCVVLETFCSSTDWIWQNRCLLLADPADCSRDLARH